MFDKVLIWMKKKFMIDEVSYVKVVEEDVDIVKNHAFYIG